MDDGSLSEIDGTRTDLSDGFRVMTDVKNGRTRGNDILDLVLAFSFEARVADAQRFVDNQHVRLDVDVDREAETHFHTAGVCSDRLVNIVAQLGEVDDFFLDLLDVFILQTENIALEIDVLTTGHLHREARGQLEQRRDLAVDDDLSGVGKGDPGNHFEQGGFTCAVIADDTDRFASVDVKGDVVERLVGFGIARLEEKSLETRLVVFVKDIGFADVFKGNDRFRHEIPPIKARQEAFS